MLTSLAYLKVIVAAALFILLYIEWRRSPSFKLRVLFILFFSFCIKEAFYLYYMLHYLPFEEAFAGATDLVELKGDYLNNLAELSRHANWDRVIDEATGITLQSTFNRFTALWSLVEAGFAVFFFYLMHTWVTLRERSLYRSLIFTVNLLMLGGGLVGLFLLDESTPLGTFTLINWGGALWAILLYVLIAISIAKIYRYTMLDLKYLVANKGMILGVLSFFMVFYIVNNLAGNNLRSFPFFIQTTALAILAVFAYRFVLFRIRELDQRVIESETEKNLVIRLLQDIGHAMAENLSQELVMERIVDAAIKSCDARSGCILLKDSVGDHLNVAHVTGLFPPVQKMELGTMVKEKFLIDKFRGSRIKIGESYLGEVAKTGESLYIQDCLRDDRVIQSAAGLMDIRSVIAVPLKMQDEILGVMSIMNKETALFFSEADLSLMQTLADQAAITLNQVKLYKDMLDKKQAEKELSVAGNIQKNLLPETFPDFPKVELAAFSHPAKGVGGDYYDMLDFGNGKIGVIVTDVAGKGVPAALVMVMIRSVLRTFAKADKEARDVITTVNNTISGEVSEERYATMFYFVFDSEYKILNYCNAGHGPLLLYRRSLDSFAMLDTEGMPVGIAAGVEYGQEYTSLHAGDIAVLYTDGVTECMNSEREQYGEERMKAVIRRHCDASAREIADIIYKEMKEFAGGAPQHDDETLLLMKAK